MVDQVVQRACQTAAAQADLTTSEGLKDGCAVVAVGGYGRRDLAPFSDVDLLFLRDDLSPGHFGGFVERVLVQLWDAGLTVGHSVRTVGECVAAAGSDLHARTALSEARLVTGGRRLFTRLEMDLDTSVFGDATRQEAFLDALREARNLRRARFGRTVCLQEPHLKEGTGGLRDLHTIVWAGRLRHGTRTLEALRDGGHLSADEYIRARRAYDFLLRVRNEAHFASGRRTDLLLLDLQPAMAAHLGYEPRKGSQASEVFMRDYYPRAQDLHAVCDAFLARTETRAPRPRLRPRWPRRRRGRFEVAERRLRLGEPNAAFPETPSVAADVFLLAQQEGVALDEGLKGAIRARLGAVDARYRGSPEAGAALLEMVGRAGRVAPALRAMHETGFLGRVLPEFARVTFMVQHDRYHRYTVDEHTLVAIEALDDVAVGADPAMAGLRGVFARIRNAAPLYLGLLLHDVGKGRGGSHVSLGARTAERICRRLRLPDAVAEDVVFLVRHHLDMSHVSQRRDLGETRVVDGFASTVKTAERLDMLLLLTYADSRGVGPGVWSEWKARLLWELYAKARLRLAGSSPLSSQFDVRARARDGLVQHLAPEFAASLVERHLALMPERYVRDLTPARLRRHLRLVRWLAARPVALGWRPGEHHTELTVCTADRAGLLAAVAGTLTAAGADILSVDAYTREDGIVIDTFLVSSAGGEQPIRPDRWKRIEASLVDAVEGRLDVDTAVLRRRREAPSRRRGREAALPGIRIDSEASEVSTVVEVRADDQPGLVYRIARTLSALGLNIALAKVATEKSQALDVFYVSEREGGKLGSQRAADVERALGEALRPEGM